MLCVSMDRQIMAQDPACVSAPLTSDYIDTQGEEIRVPAGDPRRGGSVLLCIKPLRRAGTDNMFVIFKTNNLYKPTIT